MRCFELIFTFDKEHFIRSCLEIRLRNALYNKNQKKFKKLINLQEFSDKSIIKRDMLEHGRSLRIVISALFEGVSDHLDSSKNVADLEDDEDNFIEEILPPLLSDGTTNNID
jgi:hypothetical protein